MSNGKKNSISKTWKGKVKYKWQKKRAIVIFID